jgi:hypothetical protein
MLYRFARRGYDDDNVLLNLNFYAENEDSPKYLIRGPLLPTLTINIDQALNR